MEMGVWTDCLIAWQRRLRFAWWMGSIKHLFLVETCRIWEYEFMGIDDDDETVTVLLSGFLEIKFV